MTRHRKAVLAIPIMVIAAAAISLGPSVSHAEWWSGAVTHNNPTITLNGDNPIRVVQGDTFTDPGATCAEDGDTTTVYAPETVDTDETGTNVLNYTCEGNDNSAVAIRQVIVYNTPPVITLDHTELTIDYVPGSAYSTLLNPDCTDRQDDNPSLTVEASREITGNNTATTTYDFTCTDDGDTTDPDNGALTDTATAKIHHPTPPA